MGPELRDLLPFLSAFFFEKQIVELHEEGKSAEEIHKFLVGENRHARLAAPARHFINLVLDRCENAVPQIESPV